jgi:hypothetical protein
VLISKVEGVSVIDFKWGNDDIFDKSGELLIILDDGNKIYDVFVLEILGLVIDLLVTTDLLEEGKDGVVGSVIGLFGLEFWKNY